LDVAVLNARTSHKMTFKH